MVSICLVTAPKGKHGDENVLALEGEERHQLGYEVSDERKASGPAFTAHKNVRMKASRKVEGHSAHAWASGMGPLSDYPALQPPCDFF